jgi:hypothetical protein
MAMLLHLLAILSLSPIARFAFDIETNGRKSGGKHRLLRIPSSA